MKIAFKPLVCVGSLWFMFSVNFLDQTPPKIVFVTEAEAIVGAPATPVSAAGVARRRTWGVIATEAAVATTEATATAAAASSQQQATAQQQAAVAQQQARPAGAPPIGAVVQTLPAGCTPVVVGGVSYSKCGGVFTRPLFRETTWSMVLQKNL